MTLQSAPIARTQMLIRRPADVVYRAFTEPEVTRRFWFSRASGPLEQGQTVVWYWDMYGVAAEVQVHHLEAGRMIRVAWPTPVEWVLEPRGEGATLVTITASGFVGTEDAQVAQALDAMGGFSFALAGCKAFLEHGLELNLSLDHAPDAHVSGRA